MPVIRPWVSKVCQIRAQHALSHHNPLVDIDILTKAVEKIATGGNKTSPAQEPLAIMGGRKQDWWKTPQMKKVRRFIARHIRRHPNSPIDIDSLAREAEKFANGGNKADRPQAPLAIANSGNKKAWWKTARVYQVLVMFYADSDGDGWGDFVGLRKRLKKIKKMGFNALWIHPVFKGPFRDFMYDVSNYYQFNEHLGTIEEFRELVEEAHRLGIYIILDLPHNHMSVDSEQFRAAIDPSHPEHEKYKNWFHFSDTGTEYPEAAVLFKDFYDSNWFKVRDLPKLLGWDVDPKTLVDKYFYHRFFAHQADLNYDNPEVEEELKNIASFLFDLGVDLLRMDAAPFPFKEDGGEGHPKTHALYQRIAAWIDKTYPGRGMLAEANQIPEEVIEYLHDGFKSAFDFVSMAGIFESMARGKKKALFRAIQRLRGLGLPEWAALMVFLSLHDEKTWEFVKRSVRHFLWKHYGHGESWRKQNWGTIGRLIELFDGDTDMVKLAFALMYGLPGAKLVYYGDEIGMGDTSDLPIEPDKGRIEARNATRTVYAEDDSENAGFSTAPEEDLAGPLVKKGPFNFRAANRKNQEQIQGSILNFVMGLNGLCEEYEDLMCPAPIDLLGNEDEDEEVIAWVRTAPGRSGDDVLLCVYNLSRSVQDIELDLSNWDGRELTEIGATIEGGEMHTFRRKASANYPLTLQPKKFMYILVE